MAFPFAVGYNPAGADGSNKGFSNPDYLAELQARIDSFFFHDPGIRKEDIPSDLLIASGSGLDPDILVQAAKMQVKRIAEIRNISEATINQIIEQQTENHCISYPVQKK